MSRTTKTRSTRRYCSPSPSPLRDSDRHYFSSPSPMISLSPVRYKYTYVDTTSHRPGYEAGKVGKGGKGEDYYISSSSPSPSSSSSPSPPLLRRTRSVSILRTGPRPINVQGYDRGYRDGDEDIKAPKRELKTSISYISPRSLSSKIQYSYREDVPYVIYRTSNSGSGEDWYDDARGRVRSGSRSRDERMKGRCVRCGDENRDRDRDGRCECDGYERYIYRIYQPSQSSSSTTEPSPATHTTRVHIKNINDNENRNIDLNTQHNSKREANVRVSVERERETKCERGGCEGEKRGRGREREREREGWKSIRNRTPTPYYEGFIRCRCRDGCWCGCRRTGSWSRGGARREERRGRSCERGVKSEGVLECNYISPISIPIRDAVSRSRLGGRSQNFRSRNRNRSPRRSRSRSRSKSKPREEERENAKERTRYITRIIDIPRDGSLLRSRSRSKSRSRSRSRSRLRGRDKDKSTSTSKRKTIYYLPRVSHVARGDGGRNESTSRGKFKRRDTSSSTSTSGYTSEEIEREVRIKRKYSINGGLRNEARDQGKEGGGEARGGRGRGVRFMI